MPQESDDELLANHTAAEVRAEREVTAERDVRGDEELQTKRTHERVPSAACGADVTSTGYTTCWSGAYCASRAWSNARCCLSSSSSDFSKPCSSAPSE